MWRSESSAQANASSSGTATAGTVGQDTDTERQAPSQASTSQDGSVPVGPDTVLHPDVTFGAHPYAHVLHVLAFVGCCLVSIFSLIAQLPIPPSRGSTSWWPVLVPQLCLPVISIAFHAYSILPRMQSRALRMQLGETPNPSTTVSSLAQSGVSRSKTSL